MEQEITTKLCNTCKIEKPFSGFYKDKSKKYGIASQCKQCKIEYQKRNPEIAFETRHKSYLKHKDKRNAKSAEYHAAHSSEIHERKRTHYAENSESIQLRKNTQRREHPEVSRAYGAWYYSTHKEEISEYGKRYWIENKEEQSEKYKQWALANPDKIRIKSHSRRALEINAEGSHTGEELIELWYKQSGLCYWCDVKLKELFDNPDNDNGAKPHLDHVIPLKRGGSNYISNLRWTCSYCNLSKGSKLPSEWSGSNGRWIE